MGQGGSKDKTAQMTEQNPITQGWPVHMRNIILHLTFMASNVRDSQSNSNM